LEAPVFPPTQLDFVAGHQATSAAEQ
jgi:hypothetical protein